MYPCTCNVQEKKVQRCEGRKEAEKVRKNNGKMGDFFLLLGKEMKFVAKYQVNCPKESKIDTRLKLAIRAAYLNSKESIPQVAA